jgi:crotonobetainyl-CoA:carnitine CoA-transferase CaiB-like acyl-CoA transferase
MPASSPLAGALAGIKVLDLSRLLPGPYLTMVLADMGADVVKIEDPRVGDYIRAFPPAKAGMGGRFLAINRGKRSAALDLKAPAGRDAFRRMAARADVVVESFRPGVMDKLGVGWAALSARNPKLVMCSISGYGQTGPYVDKAGHDLNYISLAGVTAMGGGERGGPPTIPGVQIADLAGGALWSATAILAALVGRDRTGAGAHLDISMTEGSLALLAAELGNQDCGARPTRGAEAINGGMACYQLYRTADDRWLSVGALEPKFWLAFAAAVGRRPDLAELAAGPADQARIRGEIQAVIATKPLAAWLEILAAHDCCCEPVLELDELADHPLHRAREVFFVLDGGSAGPIRQVRTPVGTPAHPTMPPRLGEHTRAVLADYGFSLEEIEAIAD